MELNRDEIISEIDTKIKYAKFINTDAVVLSRKAAQFCLEYSQFYEQKIKELTEENERLKAELEIADKSFGDFCRHTKKVIKRTETDTVRRMHSEIEKRCIKGGIYPAFVKGTIDQIAKEMIENG